MFGDFGSEVLVQSPLEQGVQDGEGGLLGVMVLVSLGYLGAGEDASVVGFFGFRVRSGPLFGVRCVDFGKTAVSLE